jgi:hypothetical protein
MTKAVVVIVAAPHIFGLMTHLDASLELRQW